MALESTKHYLATYLIFITILAALDIQLGVDLNIPNPPSFSPTVIFGSDLNGVIQSLLDVPLVGFLIGGAVGLIVFIVSVIIFFITFIFFLAGLLVWWTIPGQTIINLALVLYRVFLLFEILPYIKNMIHPTTQGSH
jgi:hypothetical protein